MKAGSLRCSLRRFNPSIEAEANRHGAVPFWKLPLNNPSRIVAIAARMVSLLTTPALTSLSVFVDQVHDLDATIANKSQFSPEQLADLGYRRANAGSPEIWVHPSGHEYQLMATSTVPDEPTEERCTEPCKDAEDEAGCHECCDEKIPETGVRCRAKCHGVCQDNLST